MGVLSVAELDVGRLTEATPEQEAGFGLNVTLRNTAASEPLHLADELRTIDYDEASGVLDISWREPPPSPGVHGIEPITPTQTVVPPGGQHRLVVWIPAVLKQLRFNDDGGVGMRRVDVTEWTHARCRFAYSDVPLRPHLEGSYEDWCRSLHDWGEDLVFIIERPNRPEATAAT